MLINYFKIAIRNIFKYRIFSFINIAGMAISLVSCFLIALFVWDELQYDRHQPDGDRTFRVYNISTREDGTVNYLPIVPPAFAPYIQKDFPEVESTLRFMDTYGEQLFQSGDKKFNEANGIYAEQSVFDMLGIEVTSGNPVSGFERANTVAVCETLAKKYFGSSDAVGQSIRISGNDCEVVGVFEDLPRQSHLKLNYILSFPTLTATVSPERMESWRWQQFFTYIKIKPGTDVTALGEKLPGFAEKYAYETIIPLGFRYVPHLQPLRDIHLHSSTFNWEIAQRGNAETVYVLTATACMILIIACLNFINLSTARAMKRRKEVGVRKVIGAQRGQLVGQFIAEAVLFTFAGLVIAVVLTQFAIPYLNDFVEKDINTPTAPLFFSGLIGFSVILGIVAGSYPAFHLSGFRPAAVLAKKDEGKGSAGVFRQFLMVLQFMFSFFLITSSWIILEQNKLLVNKDLGFNKEELVVIPLQNEQLRNFETTKRLFSDHPNVLSASISYGLPGDIIAGDGVTDPATGKELGANMFCIDYDYVSTMGMEIIAGRNLSREFGTDEPLAFIVNESFIKTYDLNSPEEALGKKLDWPVWGTDSVKHGEIIGVVKDFNFRSLREKVAPAVMHIYPPAYYTLSLRIKAEDISATIGHFKKVYEQMQPERIFNYKFLDKNFDAMYEAEIRLAKLFTVFTGLAIAVACLGLFGLVEFSVNQRMKEISIRKVFGASISSLMVLLTRKYFILISIAFILIIPMAWWSASQWLENFAYRIDISPLIFIKAGALVIVITVLTVSFQSLKAALDNPAQILKNE